MHSLELGRQFGQWRGAPVDIVTAYAPPASWATTLDRWWDQRGPNDPQRLSVAVELWPRDGDVSTSAAGGYNAQWREFASRLRPGDVVRIAHESNLASKADRVTPANLSQWRQAWVHAYDSIKSVQPGAIVMYNPNIGVSQNGVTDIMAPVVVGKVDMVGIDFYDSWDNRDFAWAQSRPGGLDYWAARARELGVPFGLAEWGLYHGPRGGGDNPAYIANMYGWLEANADIVGFESYYTNGPDHADSAGWQIWPQATGVAETWFGTVRNVPGWGDRPNPNAAAEYQRQVQRLSGR